MSTDATQIQRPWRALIRTLLVAALAVLPMIPEVALTLGIEEVPSVAVALTVAATAQRIISLPTVEVFLERYAPFLAADPYQGQHRKRR